MQKKRTHCKHGHRRIPENLVSIKARGKSYLTCRLCINARSRNRKTKLRLPAPLSPLPSSGLARLSVKGKCKPRGSFAKFAG